MAAINPGAAETTFTFLVDAFPDIDRSWLRGVITNFSETNSNEELCHRVCEHISSLDSYPTSGAQANGGSAPRGLEALDDAQSILTRSVQGLSIQRDVQPRGAQEEGVHGTLAGVRGPPTDRGAEGNLPVAESVTGGLVATDQQPPDPLKLVDDPREVAPRNGTTNPFSGVHVPPDPNSPFVPRPPKNEGVMINCEACGDPESHYRVVECNKRHVTCRKCMGPIATSALQGRTIVKEGTVQCPILGCGNTVPLGKLQPIVSYEESDTLRALIRHVNQQSLKAVVDAPGFYKCPFCDFIVESDEDLRVFECLKCQRRSCYMCKKEMLYRDTLKHTWCQPQAPPVQQEYQHMMVPDHWNMRQPTLPNQGYIKVVLDGNLPEYKAVAAKFYGSLSATIHSIHRVENPQSWHFYAIHRDQMRAKLGRDHIYERSLFHGTTPKQADLICQQNEFAKGPLEELYGQGNYFAATAATAHKFINDGTYNRCTGFTFSTNTNFRMSLCQGRADSRAEMFGEEVMANFENTPMKWGTQELRLRDRKPAVTSSGPFDRTLAPMVTDGGPRGSRRPPAAASAFEPAPFEPPPRLTNTGPPRNYPPFGDGSWHPMFGPAVLPTKYSPLGNMFGPAAMPFTSSAGGHYQETGFAGRPPTRPAYNRVPNNPGRVLFAQPIAPGTPANNEGGTRQEPPHQTPRHTEIEPAMPTYSPSAASSSAQSDSSSSGALSSVDSTWPSSGSTLPSSGSTWPSSGSNLPSSGSNWSSSGSNLPSSGSNWSSSGSNLPSSGSNLPLPSSGSNLPLFTFPSNLPSGGENFVRMESNRGLPNFEEVATLCTCTSYQTCSKCAPSKIAEDVMANELFQRTGVRVVKYYFGWPVPAGREQLLHDVEQLNANLPDGWPVYRDGEIDPRYTPPPRALVNIRESCSTVLCKVVVGKFTKGKHKYDQAPIIQTTTDTYFYDSCVDDLFNPKLFVTFEKWQSYPEYIVTYSETPFDFCSSK